MNLGTVKCNRILTFNKRAYQLRGVITDLDDNIEFINLDDVTEDSAKFQMINKASILLFQILQVEEEISMGFQILTLPLLSPSNTPPPLSPTPDTKTIVTLMKEKQDILDIHCKSRTIGEKRKLSSLNYNLRKYAKLKVKSILNKFPQLKKSHQRQMLRGSDR